MKNFINKKTIFFSIFSLSILLCIILIISIFYRNKLIIRSVKEDRKSIKAGLLLYRYDDTFIDNLRRSIESYIIDYEKEKGIKINIDIVDAQNNYINQNKQASKFISLGYDVLMINPVDRTNVSNIIDSAISNNIPIVFFNREPVDDDLHRSKDIFYIGTNAKQSAVLQGKMIVELYKKKPEALDKNNDGFIDYILLEGEKSHQDSLIRTKWSIKTLQDEGVPIRKIDGSIANWERSQASAIYEEFFKKYDNIELVISNNDDMAMGVIDTIDRLSPETFEDNKYGLFNGPVIVGIDGTPDALNYIQDGKLFGTVVSDRNDYAKKIIDTAINAVLKNNIESSNKFYDVELKAISRYLD